DAAGAARPAEPRHIQSIDGSHALVKVVRMRHGREELLDIAGLIGRRTQCIPGGASHRNAVGAIRLRKRTAIQLYVSKHAIAPQAPRVRTAVRILRWDYTAT